MPSTSVVESFGCHSITEAGGSGGMPSYITRGMMLVSTNPKGIISISIEVGVQ